MGHIHAEPGQHDLTAGGFVMRLDQKEPRILLHWHKKLNMWLQFGGHVELHENPWQAAAREITEESGYTLEELQLLQPRAPRLHNSQPDALTHPFPIAFITVPIPGEIEHYHIDTSFAFTVKTAPKRTMGNDESTNLRLFTRDEIVALPESDIQPNVRDITLFFFDECLPNWKSMPATDWQR